MPRVTLPPVKVGAMVEDYMSQLDPNLSPRTVDSKQRTLRILCAQLPRGENTLTRNLQEIHFADCMADIANGASAAENDSRKKKCRGQRLGRNGISLKNDRATLKQFAQYLVYREVVKASFNPMYEITKAQRARGKYNVTKVRRRQHVPFNEWPKLLDAAPHPRDRLLVALGLWLGCRASDMVVLQWHHIHLDENKIELFNVKRGRRVGAGRLLPLGPMREEIDRYLAWFKPLHGEPAPDWPLLPTKVAAKDTACRDSAVWPVVPHEAMGSVFVTMAVQQTLLAFGWPAEDMLGEGAHTLRRSLAEACVEYGGDRGDELAMFLLDHESIDTTRKSYTTRSRQLREASSALESGFGTIEPPKHPKPPEPMWSESQPLDAVTQKDEPEAIVFDFATRKRIA